MDIDAQECILAVELGRALPVTYGRGRARRLSTDLYRGDVFVHFTICAEESGSRPFADHAVARMVCKSVEHAAAMLDHRIAAYCLMPDHMHLLVSAGCSGVSALELLRRFKSFTTAEYRRMTGDARLWQYSARDRVIRRDERLEEIAAYIANNPVRAGLVSAWMEWPYTRVCVGS
ncbi:Transposase IS200 like protein [Phycisphaerae bacterium RAS1]|nr:Transposase IS200 like protein [Phycisphaerae bacterium RAS1]